MFDFQRLRRSTDLNAAPLIAASIFLDALNVFLFFLQIYGKATGLSRHRGVSASPPIGS